MCTLELCEIEIGKLSVYYKKKTVIAETLLELKLKTKKQLFV